MSHISDTAPLQKWVADQLNATVDELNWQALSGDASFRRYFRCEVAGQSFIVALAPPETEKNHEFVEIASLLNAAGVQAPMVIAVDYDHGFILQNDLGDRLLLPQLRDDTVDSWYHQAMHQLLQMLTITQDRLAKLPAYDEEALKLELSYFQTWFLEAMLDYQCSAAEQRMLDSFFDELVDSALDQPQQFVHRDYHSRNIMITDDHLLVTIDFQDAVCGPITYDLVSLLRDCYVVWPEQRVRAWVSYFYKKLIQQGQLRVDETIFQRWFDLMGLQRHIKVLGVFSRLSIRDDKHGYLQDLPVVVNYVLAVARQQECAEDFLEWFEDRILPLIRKQSWGANL